MKYQGHRATSIGTMSEEIKFDCEIQAFMKEITLESGLELGL